MGYIYIASNKGFKKDLLKIGISNIHPEIRLKSLSQQTAAPAKFDLEFFSKTNKPYLIETRVHSLLKKYRLSLNREFFLIKLDDAINLIKYVIEYTDIEGTIATSIAKHNDLISAIYKPHITVTELKLINIIMASTNFSILKNLSLITRDDIIDGFLQAERLANLLSISNSYARQIMQKFSKRALELNVYFLEKDEELNVFKSCNYNRGDLNWLFADEFLPLFYNLNL